MAVFRLEYVNMIPAEGLWRVGEWGKERDGAWTLDATTLGKAQHVKEG